MRNLILFYPNMGTFAKSAHLYVPKSAHLYPNENSETSGNSVILHSRADGNDNSTALVL